LTEGLSNQGKQMTEKPKPIIEEETEEETFDGTSLVRVRFGY
jgi:hypothetical protein